MEIVSYVIAGAPGHEDSMGHGSSIVPGLPPGYDQKSCADAGKRGRLRLVAHPDGARGSVTIRQDGRIYAGLCDDHGTVSRDIAEGRLAHVHVVRGKAVVKGHATAAGDALLHADEPQAAVESGEASQLLVLD